MGDVRSVEPRRHPARRRYRCGCAGWTSASSSWAASPGVSRARAATATTAPKRARRPYDRRDAFIAILSIRSPPSASTRSVQTPGPRRFVSHFPPRRGVTIPRTVDTPDRPFLQSLYSAGRYRAALATPVAVGPPGPAMRTCGSSHGQRNRRRSCPENSLPDGSLPTRSPGASIAAPCCAAPRRSA